MSRYRVTAVDRVVTMYDGERWLVIDANSRKTLGSFPTLLAAENFATGRQVCPDEVEPA